MTSLPVPVSPRRSTGTSESFTFSTIRSISFISAEVLGTRRVRAAERSDSRKPTRRQAVPQGAALLFDDREQEAVVDRLGDVIRRTGLHALHGAVDVAVTGDDDHRDGRLLGLHLLQQGQAVLFAEAQVEEHQVDLVGEEELPHLGGAGRLQGVVPLEGEELGQAVAQAGLVVNDEDVHGHGDVTSTFVPLPGVLETRISPPARLTIA